MADQFKEFIDVLDAFDKHGVDYVLIGGVAVILHGMERLTRDIDIFIKAVPENINRLRNALHALFDDPSIEEITLRDLNEYAVIRYGTPNAFYVDIMARLGNAVTYDSLRYEMIIYRGTRIRIATPETLYELKKDTSRERDKMDVMFLKELIESRRSIEQK